MTFRMTTQINTHMLDSSRSLSFLVSSRHWWSGCTHLCQRFTFEFCVRNRFYWVWGGDKVWGMRQRAHTRLSFISWIPRLRTGRWPMSL